MNAVPHVDLKSSGEKVLILGIGNTFRGDDGIGPILIRRLQGKTRSGLLDCGEVPENHLQKIIDSGPSTILIVDAADWGGVPGEIRQVGPEEIANPTCSGHDCSLRLFLDYLQAHLRARILIWGVQVRQREYRGSLSPEAKRALKILEDRLVRLLPPADNKEPGGGSKNQQRRGHSR